MRKVINIQTEIKPGDIQEAIERVSGIPTEKLYTRTRKREISDIRQLTCYMFYKLLPQMTFKEIGREFNYDHTTVIHSVNKVEGYVRTNDMIGLLFRKALKILGIEQEDKFDILQENDFSVSVRVTNGVLLLQQEQSIMTLTQDTIRSLYLSTLIM